MCLVIDVLTDKGIEIDAQIGRQAEMYRYRDK